MRLKGILIILFVLFSISAWGMSPSVYYYGNSTNATNVRGGSLSNSTDIVSTAGIWLERGGIAWFNGTSGYSGESGSFNATIQIRPNGQSAWMTVDTLTESKIAVDGETKSTKINAGGWYRIKLDDISTGFAEFGIDEITPR